MRTPPFHEFTICLCGLRCCLCLIDSRRRRRRSASVACTGFAKPEPEAAFGIRFPSRSRSPHSPVLGRVQRPGPAAPHPVVFYPLSHRPALPWGSCLFVSVGVSPWGLL